MIVYVLAYLIGAIPTGYLLARSFGIDITKHGSGNIGATNVARVLGSKKYFFLIFFLDVLKAAGFLYLAQAYANQPQLLYCGVAILLGNAYSIFLRFRGGKGVAASFGVLLALFPLPVTLTFFITWVLMLTVVRRADVASLTASLCTTLGAASGLLAVTPYQVAFLLFMTFFLTWRHRSNLCDILGICI